MLEPGLHRRRNRNLLSAASALCLLALLAPAVPVAGQGGVLSTVHNLSASGPGTIHSMSETEVCKFCHIPHNAVVAAPLWGHALSRAQYETPSLRRGRPGESPVPQPDGSSRLCLSCHDGTVALGDVAGEPRPIPMSGRERLGPGDRGFLGTDLSGSHPVSFVVEEGYLSGEESDDDIGLRFLADLRTDPEVKLDSGGKMQCTSCHDPHSDRYYVPGKVPHFWVKPTVEEVCTTCHTVR